MRVHLCIAQGFRLGSTTFLAGVPLVSSLTHVPHARRGAWCACHTQGLSALTVWGKPPTVRRANGSGNSAESSASLAVLIKQQDALLAAAAAQVCDPLVDLSSGIRAP